MNDRDLKKFEKLLMKELETLDEGIRTIERDSLGETIRDSSGDLSGYAEAGTDEFERETALSIATRESNWLSDVNEALKRIKSGQYGTCEGCEEEIPKKRLEVFPSARYCVKCQSKLEKEGSL